MKIFLFKQKSKFSKHLEYLKQVPVMNFNPKDLIEKTTAIHIPINSVNQIQNYNFNYLLNFKIFPSSILTGYPQWEEEKRSIQPGDTIVQQVYLPPILSFSQKLIFGVRVKEVINETHRIGFSYETLEGHVEKGISIFTAELNPDSKILTFQIKTFSTPGNFLSKLAGPIFSIPYQTYCTKKALENLKANFIKFNSNV